MNTVNGMPLRKDIYSKIVRQVDMKGHDPSSSNGFRIIQQHAIDHPSMEFSNDESLVDALAGSFDTSEDFHRLDRMTAKQYEGTKYDPARMRNLPADNSPLPVYHAEFTRLRESNGQSSSTDMSSLDGPNSAACSRNDAVASTSNAAKRSTGPTLVRQKNTNDPAALIRQKQINDCDRRANAKPSTLAAIDVNENDVARQMYCARPKSAVAGNSSDPFTPSTFSTPLAGTRPQASQLPTNSVIDRPSISPVLVDEPLTASVPIHDAQTMANKPSARPPTTPLRAPDNEINAPKSATKQSRIPQWARESTKKATQTAPIAATALRLPIHESAAPKSVRIPSPRTVSDVNPSARPPPNPENIDKAQTPTPSARVPIVTFNVTVNNTPAASQAAQRTQTSQTPRPNEVNANVSPVNSNRVTSTMATNKSTTNHLPNEILLSDDNDDNQIDEVRPTPIWKSVVNRHATPGIQLIENRCSEANKSSRRQLFQARSNASNESQRIDEQPEPRELDVNTAADDNDCVIINVITQRSNIYETHSIVTEQSTVDRSITRTQDKERTSFRNHTYDISTGPIVGSQPTQQSRNASASQIDEPEPSGMPSDAILNSIDSNSMHDVVVVDGSQGSNNSSAASSFTSSNFGNHIQIVSVQSLHPNYNVNPSKPMKSSEFTTTGNQTSIRNSQRPALMQSFSVNNHSVRLPSLSVATSTTNALRESETFTSIPPPPHFQDDEDDQTIEEHSVSVGREMIQKLIESGKSKSQIPLTLSNPSRTRPRRKNKLKSNAHTEFDDETDDNQHVSQSQNGRRTLYTKGYSDGEDNDAISANALPSTSHAAQRELNSSKNQITVSSSSPTTFGRKTNENVPFEKNSMPNNSTMRTTEPEMTTMNDKEPPHLSDINEEVEVENSAEQQTAKQVRSKSARNSTKSNAKKKSNAKTKSNASASKRQTMRKNVEMNTVNEETANTDGMRRSTRARSATTWATQGLASAYEMAIQRAIGKRRVSPTKTKEPEPADDIRPAASKKRRVTDKANRMNKFRVDSTEAVAEKSSNRKERKRQTKVTKNVESIKTLDRDYICQVAKDLRWFDDLCSTRALPALVNQEGVYKIHTNHLDSVQIESTSYGQVHYFPDGKIDYGFFPGILRSAGIMRFHTGAIKATSTTENCMGLEVLKGSFELWQGKHSIDVTPGIIVIQPGTSYRIKHVGSNVGVILFHLYEKGE